MAVIDTFLKLMVDKRAERLVLASDEVPYLLKGEETIKLSMPALPAEMVRRISREVLGTEEADATDRQRAGTFRMADGAEFDFSVIPRGAQSRIEFHAREGSVPTDSGPGDELLARAAAAFVHPESGGRPAPGNLASSTGPELLVTIDQAVSLDASDVFFSAGRLPRMRWQGLIRPLGSEVSETGQILGLLPSDGHRRELERSGSVDFAVRWELSGGGRRFRVNVFRHLDGVAAALRPIRPRIPRLADLGLPEDFLELALLPHGLVLVTGASGSGKSTTLAALIDHINRSQARHVITIEDPVEFVHRDIKALIHQREVGTNVESFSSGLRAALRENPDVVMLGELRDLATISAALTAAETGHLVLGTLHTGSASAAVSRIVDVFPGYQQAHVRVQLAASLRAVVSQRLLPGLDKGLVPAVERLLVTPAVANSIRDGHEHHMRSAMQTGVQEGMITLERSLAALVRRRAISRETALRHAYDPQALDKLLG
jgi:twitching motility protein PilT